MGLEVRKFSNQIFIIHPVSIQQMSSYSINNELQPKMLRLPNPKQLLFLSLLYHLVSCTVTPKRKKLVALGDFMIGALVPVHEQPSLTSGSKKVCGLIRDQYGVQRVEALLYMLDKINNKSQTNLLQGVKLGLEIRDECWETSIGKYIFLKA